MSTDFDSNCVYYNELPLESPGCSQHLSRCRRCHSKLYAEDTDFTSKWIDPLVILDRRREETTVLRNLLAGRGAFLLCGGPSANDQPLEMLSKRGIWSLAVNNMAGHSRTHPNAFVCSDPPRKFSHSIWLDPAIMKFIPIPKLKPRRGQLRRRTTDGQFIPLEQSACDCANVWGFKRNSWLMPDESFFTADGACWGNHAQGVKATGQPKSVCTTLLGLRLLMYLGASTVYLVGVDFRMTDSSGYSFAQKRDADAAASNNHLFSVVNKWLCTMQESEVFKKFGMAVYNTFERSGLRAFPYVPFEEAIEVAQGLVEDEPDLRDWYNPEN